MSEENIVIVSARRTPMGSFQGDLSSLKATELGSIVVKKNLDSLVFIRKFFKVYFTLNVSLFKNTCQINYIFKV